MRTMGFAPPGRLRGCQAGERFLPDKPLHFLPTGSLLRLYSLWHPPPFQVACLGVLCPTSCCLDQLLPAYIKQFARLFLCVAGLHKSDQQYLKSARDKTKKPNEEFLYATTASKRAERQRLVRFIRSVIATAMSHLLRQIHANSAAAALCATAVPLFAATLSAVIVPDYYLQLPI